MPGERSLSPSTTLKNVKCIFNKAEQIFSPKNKIAAYLALILVIPVITIPSYRMYKKRQTPFYTQGLKYLPNKIRAIIHTKHWPRHIAMLVIKDRKLSTYGNFVEEGLINHLKIIEATVMRLLQNNSPIPDGKYLLSLEDGVESECALPLLAYASNHSLVANNKIVLIPDVHVQMQDEQGQIAYTKLLKSVTESSSKYVWDKKIPKILWRGGAYGMARLQFMRAIMAHDYNFVDAGIAYYDTEKNKKLFGMPTKNVISPEESLAYKYLIDVDGYSCSYSRVAWILTSNSLLLKHSSPNVQWYYHNLQPYVHYLPINEDFSDLQKQYEWAEANQEQAQQIIANAQALAQAVFTPAAIDHATEEALIQYSRVFAKHIATYKLVR